MRFSWFSSHEIPFVHPTLWEHLNWDAHSMEWENNHDNVLKKLHSQHHQVFPLSPKSEYKVGRDLSGNMTGAPWAPTTVLSGSPTRTGVCPTSPSLQPFSGSRAMVNDQKSSEHLHANRQSFLVTWLEKVLEIDDSEGKMRRNVPLPPRSPFHD